MSEIENKQTVQAYAASIKLLARREYAQSELMTKLAQKGFEQSVILSVLDELVIQGYQSDARFTDCFVRYQANNGKGPVWIKQQLLQKAIKLELIEKTLLEWREKWDALIKQLYDKRFGTMPGNQQERQKRYRFLQSRGFVHDQIKTVL